MEHLRGFQPPKARELSEKIDRVKWVPHVSFQETLKCNGRGNFTVANPDQCNVNYAIGNWAWGKPYITFLPTPDSHQLDPKERVAHFTHKISEAVAADKRFDGTNRWIYLKKVYLFKKTKEYSFAGGGLIKHLFYYVEEPWWFP